MSQSRIDGLPALGSATHGPHIFDAREPWGGPRFHPPGEHPATYRWREHRRKLAAFMDRTWPFDPDPHAVEMMAYIDRKLAEFEAGEDEAKRRQWYYIRDRAGVQF